MPDLAAEYVRVEVKIGHRFTLAHSMAEIVAEAAAGVDVPVLDWSA